MRMDFDMLNAVLGVELNTQMSPVVMQAVLRRRVNELSADDKNGLPEIVVEVILAIDGNHMAKEFAKYLKKKPKKAPETKVAPTTPQIEQATATAPVLPKADRVKIALTEEGLTMVVDGLRPVDVMRHLAATRAWISWCFYNQVMVKTCAEHVIFCGTIFSEFNLTEIRLLFKEQFDL